MDPYVRTRLRAEETARAFLFIQPKVILPGQGPFRAGLYAGFWTAGKTDLDLFLLGPLGADPDSRTFWSDVASVSDGTDDLTDATACT